MVPDANDVRILRRRYPKKPTGEIHAMCRRVVPAPAVLRKNVDGVIDLFRKRDADILASTANDHLELNSGDNERPIFFNRQFKNVYRKQMAHVCRDYGASIAPRPSRAADHVCGDDCPGCLSDPPEVMLYHERPEKRPKPGDPPHVTLYFTSRGSSQAESMHRLLRQAVASTTCGAVRAEHAVGAFVYRWNVDRGVDKLGDEDYGTYHHEVLALINSLAASCGVPAAKLPYPSLKVGLADPSTEKIGMECQTLVRDQDLPLGEDAAAVEDFISEINVMNGLR